MDKILIIDDDLQFTETKIISWKINYKLDLIAIDNWQDGVNSIRNNNYAGIILDVKCKKDKQSLPDETIGLQMLNEVLDYFDKTNSDIPVVVWTNYPNQKEMWQRTGILETLSRDIKIYTKTEEDEKKLVELLKESMASSKKIFYKNKYNDEYTILKNRISKKVADSFLDFAIETKNNTPTKIKKNFLVPREILESTLNKMAENFPNLEKAWKQNNVDYYLEKYNKKIKLDKWGPINALNWMKDNARKNGLHYSDILNSYFHILRMSTNIFSAHEYKGLESVYLFKPTIHTSKATLHMMLEIVCWFDVVMDGNDID